MYSEKLQKVLSQYIIDTLNYIGTVRSFYEELPEWMKNRQNELKQIAKADQGKLTSVLKNTLEGLEKQNRFLDALEILAVTSQLVFQQNQAVNLSEEAIQYIYNVIQTSRLLCPLLLKFKRDTKAFFSPRLQNVEVLSVELDKYMETTQNICIMLPESDINLDVNKETLVHFDECMSEDIMQEMLCHINQLTKIRMDPHFRLVFLFQGKHLSEFIREFSERDPKMLQSLKELEDSAVQLDRMNKGAKISGVAGSSVGAVGGVLSILGLVLSPFTAGLSLGMLIGGAALGITSGVNSIVTAATEVGVNATQQNKASEVLQSLMNDLQCIQDCLSKASSHMFSNIEERGIDYAVVTQAIEKLADMGEDIYSLGNDISDVKVVRQLSRIMENTANAAYKGSLALTKSARRAFIGLNTLFLGLDVVFICIDSISLAKGSETEVSKFIRARSELWLSEMNSWRKMKDSLCEGLREYEKKKDILERQFYM